MKSVVILRNLFLAPRSLKVPVFRLETLDGCKCCMTPLGPVRLGLSDALGFRD